MGVVIVGGGPGGLTTGLLLARGGVDVRVVETEPDFARSFRGEGLMPSGMDALHQMGLGHIFETIPSRKLESWDMYIDGKPIFSVPEPYQELGDRASRVVPQDQFLEAILNETRAYPNFRFDFDARFRDLIRDHGRTSGAVLHTLSGEERVDADLVIGCDGRGSLVRARADLKLKLLPQSFDVFWFKLPAPASLHGTCSMSIMATSTVASMCYTSWDDYLRYALTIPRGVRAPTEDADYLEEMARPAPPWLANHIRNLQPAEVEGPVRLKILIGRCERWTAPGVLVIGDAAHPMSPIRAQGINLALRDAIVTANQLVPAFENGVSYDAVDAAAAKIQTARAPEIARAQHLQYSDTRFWGTKLAPFFVTLAKSVGPVLGQYQWAKNAWRNQQRDLWFGSTNVDLEV